MKKYAVAIGACSVLLLSFGAVADTFDLDRDRELRYWAEPSNPEPRRSAVLVAFRRAHPCPATAICAP